MKKKWMRIVLALAVFSFILISTGIPRIIIRKVEQAQRRAEIREKAQPIAEAYLSAEYDEFSLESVKNNFSAMSHGQPNRYVVVQYTTNHTPGTLLIDTESSKVWDSTGGDRMREELTDFLETELALPEEHRLDVGWQILEYDDEANGGAFEEKGYYFVPAGCETAEDLLDEAMITAAVKYDVSTEASVTIAPQNAQALFDRYPDCNATIWVIIMDPLQTDRLYEESILYCGYHCGFYDGAGVVHSCHMTDK